MRCSTSLFLLLFLLAGLTACNTPPQTPAGPEASPDALIGQFVDAWNADDSTAIRAMLTDDAVLLGEGGEALSGAAIGAWMNRQMPATSGLNAQASASGAGADLAFHAGRWTLTVNTPDTSFESSGTHTFIWARQDTSWAIRSLHIQNDAPPPAE